MHRVGRSLALVLVVVTSISESTQGASSSVGREVPAITLVDASGSEWTSTSVRECKATAVVFIGTGCPVANLFLHDLNELQAEFGSSGLRVVAVNANEGDEADAIQRHKDEFKISFPVLIDADQRLADALGATRTPEAFLLDGKGIVRYQGRIDDRYGYTYRRDKTARADLAEAVKEVLAGQEVSVARTETAGCLIARSAASLGNGPVTFAKDVSRIISSKCGYCHREGAAGPFVLQTFEDAVKWAETIAEVVGDGRMPPWHSDAPFGHFSNDRRLTSTEKDLLVKWIQSGKPKGDDADLPAPTQYHDSGWAIGQPDIVLKMPQQVTVQADGVVPYQYYVTPTNFKEDVWVTAAEARPGNRRVVHHIIIFFKDPKSKLPMADANGKSGFLVGTAPGDMPMVLPPGVARRIPAGSDLVWQMHYTPTGKEEVDLSELGLIVHRGEEPPKYNSITKGISQRWFRIPANADNHRVDSEFTFQEDAILLSFMPHMHLRGKAFHYEAIFPDGKTETLLNIPKYDFNWQSCYRLAQPKSMPKGTKIHCVAHFDNSKNNPANPDPTKNVVWGDQTWEEMMIGWIDYMKPALTSTDGNVAHR
jgi:peroxiredoxin